VSNANEVEGSRTASRQRSRYRFWWVGASNGFYLHRTSKLRTLAFTTARERQPPAARGHRNPTFGRADLLHARRFGSVRMCRHPAPLRRCEAVVCLRVCVQSVLGHERIDQVGWQRLRSCAPKLRNRGRRRHGFNFGLGEMLDQIHFS